MSQIIATFVLIFFSPLITIAALDDRSSVTDLDSEIKKLTTEVERLSAQEREYSQAIARHQKQATSLKNRLSELDLSINRTRNRVERTKIQIDRTKLEIKALDIRIAQKETQSSELRQGLSELIERIAMLQETSPLLLILASTSLASAIEEYDALERFENETTKRMQQIQNVRERLGVEREDRTKKGAELTALLEELAGTTAKLAGERGLKLRILEETRNSETKYSSLLDEIKRELNQVNSEVLRLDKLLRQKLDAEGKIKALGAAVLSWPVPGRTITTEFHDPEYPFRRVFEHNGIDIRAGQGTSVVASAPGYVGKARDGGARGYSYIMIIHGEEITTVYGHLSQITVKEGAFVRRGEVIGNSGGLPGTRGAGPFSTGAHLHFEVRRAGIALNPLQFLPR